MRRRKLVSIVLFVMLVQAIFAAYCQFASACPMCKDSIPNSENGEPSQNGSLPGGFNVSVYVLLLGLFFTIGCIAVGLVRGIRSADAMSSRRLTSGELTSGQSSRGFEVQPSDSSQGGTE